MQFGNYLGFLPTLLKYTPQFIQANRKHISPRGVPFTCTERYYHFSDFSVNLTLTTLQLFLYPFHTLYLYSNPNIDLTITIIKTVNINTIIILLSCLPVQYRFHSSLFFFPYKLQFLLLFHCIHLTKSNSEGIHFLCLGQ